MSHQQYSKKEPLCPIHTTGNHSLSVCKAFARLSFQERKDILFKSGLCFRCFGQHRQVDCNVNVVCSICKKSHATVMHRHSNLDEPVSRNRPNATFSTGERGLSSLCIKMCDNPSRKNCSKTLLIDVTLPSRSTKSLRCYCIIDEQSSSSFVDPRIKDFFKLSFPLQEHNLTTLSGSRTSTKGYIVEGLKTQGVSQKKAIHLPPVYTNEFIPNYKNEAASPSIVSAHKHIAYLAKNFNELNESCEVLVLIGRDCGAAMSTKCFGFKAPYAHHTPLGWALVGQACPTADGNTLKSTVCVMKTTISDMHMEVSPRFLEKHEMKYPDFLIFSLKDQMTNFQASPRMMLYSCLFFLMAFRQMIKTTLSCPCLSNLLIQNFPTTVFQFSEGLLTL